MNVVIRPETSTDHEGVSKINRLAFGRDAEALLVDQLRFGGHVRLSLVAEQDSEIVGHIMFSELPIITDGGAIAALALAPLTVLPPFQRSGIGSALVRQGLDDCRKSDHRIIVVLGHPYFYSRFGFSSKLTTNLVSPFSGRESFMALELTTGALNDLKGRVEYTPPFNRLG